MYKDWDKIVDGIDDGKSQMEIERLNEAICSLCECMTRMGIIGNAPFLSTEKGNSGRACLICPVGVLCGPCNKDGSDYRTFARWVSGDRRVPRLRALLSAIRIRDAIETFEEGA